MNSLLSSSFRPAALPAEAEVTRTEVRSFLATNLPASSADVRARSWMGFDTDFSRKLAERKWVGVTLAAKYGGANLDAFSRFVLVEELLSVGATVAAHWIADRKSGPLILKFGSEEQRSFYLPKICSAEAFFCIGMSEPNSGSDLASVTTRATRTNGGWRLNGRKVWTTNAHRSHYMIGLVRSSGQPLDRQKGLSQFVIDLSLPGVTVRPIRDLAGDTHFSEVFFEDVLLADDAMIGVEGGLGPGECRTRIRAKRARTDLLEHRPVGVLDRLAAAQS
jgi:alkylation response protein AidB-like acyl-CoA dehydrogenase